MPEDDPFADAGPGTDPLIPAVPAPAGEPDPFRVGEPVSLGPGAATGSIEAAELWADEPGDAAVDAALDDGGWDPDPQPVAPLPPPSRLLATSPTDEGGPTGTERIRLLDAVGGRATEIRRRRRTTSVGIMAAALLLLGAAVTLRAGGEGEQVTAGPTSTTLTPFRVPELSAVGGPPNESPTTPKPRTAPTLRPAAPGPTAVASTRQASTTTDPRPPGDRPDGRPGWVSATGRCDDLFRLPVDAGPPDPNLSMTLDVATSTVASGEILDVTVALVNRGSLPIKVFLRVPSSRTDTWFLGAPDQAASVTLTKGEPMRESVVVPSAATGGTVVLARSVRASRCADTSAGFPPGLTSSTYLVGASLDVGLSEGGELRPWRSPQQRVLVTA